jgi:hypothetical protein
MLCLSLLHINQPISHPWPLSAPIPYHPYRPLAYCSSSPISCIILPMPRASRCAPDERCCWHDTIRQTRAQTVWWRGQSSLWGLCSAEANGRDIMLPAVMCCVGCKKVTLFSKIGLINVGCCVWCMVYGVWCMVCTHAQTHKDTDNFLSRYNC